MKEFEFSPAGNVTRAASALHAPPTVDCRPPWRRRRGRRAAARAPLPCGQDGLPGPPSRSLHSFLDCCENPSLDRLPYARVIRLLKGWLAVVRVEVCECIYLFRRRRMYCWAVYVNFWRLATSDHKSISSCCDLKSIDGICPYFDIISLLRLLHLSLSHSCSLPFSLTLPSSDFTHSPLPPFLTRPSCLPCLSA